MKLQGAFKRNASQIDAADKTVIPDRTNRTDNCVETQLSSLHENRIATLLSVCSALLWPAQAALIAWVVSALIMAQTPPWIAAPLFLFLCLLRAIMDWLAERSLQEHATRAIADLRMKILTSLLWQSPFGASEDSAAQAALIGEKSAMLRPWLEQFVPAMARARVIPIVILLLVLSQSWTAALALAVTGPLIPVFMMLIGYAAQAASRDHLVEAGALNSVLADRIAALADFRLLGATHLAEADLVARSTGLRVRVMKVLRLAFLSSTVLELMASLGVAMVAVQMGTSLLGLVSWGGWGGQISVFGAIFVLLIVPEFYQPMRDLASAWHDRAAALAVLDEARRSLAQDGPRILGAEQISAVSARTPMPLVWTDLVISSAPGALIRLPAGQIMPGASIAVTGPSGSGKSTLLAALAGLLPVADGMITYGDTQLNAASAAWLRQGLGWLPQQPRFPAMSLGAWLRSADPDAHDEHLKATLRKVQLGDLVRILPQGLATRLGEAGGGVSGGEARRLLIARALLAPPILLFADEPTADLDHEAAQAITRALLALRTTGTALLIATHDRRLIAAMDHGIDLGGAGRAA